MHTSLMMKIRDNIQETTSLAYYTCVSIFSLLIALACLHHTLLKIHYLNFHHSMICSLPATQLLGIQGYILIFQHACSYLTLLISKASQTTGWFQSQLYNLLVVGYVELVLRYGLTYFQDSVLASWSFHDSVLFLTCLSSNITWCCCCTLNHVLCQSRHDINGPNCGWETFQGFKYLYY